MLLEMLFDRFLCDACSRVASACAGCAVRRLRRGLGERRACAGGARRERRRRAAQGLPREGLLRGEGVARRDGDPRGSGPGSDPDGGVGVVE